MSEEKIKPIAFYDRNHNRRYIHKTDYDEREHRVLSFTETLNEKTGTVSKKSSYRTVNRYEEMKNYKISDFSIENLTAIGAKLQTTQLKADTNMHLAHQ